MPDTNLATSKALLLNTIDGLVPSATAADLRKYGQIAKLIGADNDTALETKINSRVNSLAASASTDDLVSLGESLGFVSDTPSQSVDLSTIAQNIVPDEDNTRNLGESSKKFNYAYLNNISIVNGTITSTPTNGDHIVNKSYVDSITLESLTNVTITTPSNGQVLKYDGSSWTNQADGGGSAINSIGDISDVSTSGVTSGQVLKYNGSSWAPADDTGGGGGTINALNDINNVAVGSATNGQFLKYDGSNWIPSAVTTTGAVSSINGFQGHVNLTTDDIEEGVIHKYGKATISDTAPTGISEGTLWYDSSNSKLLIFYDSSWIEV